MAEIYTFKEILDNFNKKLEVVDVNKIEILKKIRDEIYKKYNLFMFIEFSDNNDVYLQAKKDNIILKIFLKDNKIINWFFNKNNSEIEVYEIYKENFGLPLHLSILLAEELR